MNMKLVDFKDWEKFLGNYPYQVIESKHVAVFKHSDTGEELGTILDSGGKPQFWVNEQPTSSRIVWPTI